MPCHVEDVLTLVVGEALMLALAVEDTTRLAVGQAPYSMARGGPCGQSVRGQGAIRYYDIG
jgi:hypothetical protein